MPMGLSHPAQRAKAQKELPMSVNHEKPSFAVTYGEATFDFAALPHTTLMAMLRRGVSHYLGNEYNSATLAKEVAALTSHDDAEVQKANRTKWEAMTTPERKAVLAKFRAENADQVRAIYDAEMAERVKDMQDGNVGVSVRGPSVDPLSAIMNRLAKAEVVDILKHLKVAVPKKSEDKVSFADGQAFTMAELVSRRLNPELPSGVDARGDYGKAGEAHKTRIERAAKKVMDDQAKAHKKAAEAAAGANL